MKRPHRLFRRFAAVICTAMLLLPLAGCSWFFMPGPVIVTDEETQISSTAEARPTKEESSSFVSESTTPPGTPAASDTADASSEDIPDSSSTPAEESSAAESGWHNAASTEESTEAPNSFSIDYFRTPECLRAVASDAVFVDAYNVISACLAYRTSAKVNCAKEDAGRVVYIADTLCPLLKAFTDISEDNWADGEMRWNFYVEKAKFAIIRASFEAQVAEYITPFLDPVYTETERALLIYHAYTAPASYNYEIISGVFKTYTEADQHRIHSAYAGIVDHTGVCHDLAGGMTFLFIQAGFNACRVTVINDKDEHSWTLIELDGRFTYCDATWDVGGYFSFFGNSAGDRTSQHDGSFLLKEMNIYDYNAPEHFDIVNLGLGQLQQFSYTRLVRGTRLFMNIDTETSPHRLTFYTKTPGDQITVVCP